MSSTKNRTEATATSWDGSPLPARRQPKAFQRGCVDAYAVDALGGPSSQLELVLELVRLHEMRFDRLEQG